MTDADEWREHDVNTSQRRLSIRAVSMTYGIPARVIARAIHAGELPAMRTITETGRERAYIAAHDVEAWIASNTTSADVVQMAQARS